MSLCATAAAGVSSITPAHHSLMEQGWRRPRYKVVGNCHPCRILALGTESVSKLIEPIAIRDVELQAPP